MTENRFFEKKGPFTLGDIINKLNIEDKEITKSSTLIEDIQNLNTANNNDITFFNSQNYKDEAQKTKAKVCITTQKLKKHLPRLRAPCSSMK